MLYTDGIHLISDTSVEELVEFGEGIGLKREWIHWTPGRPHLDLINEDIRSKAIAAGAQRAPRREFVAALRRMPTYQAWKAESRDSQDYRNSEESQDSHANESWDGNADESRDGSREGDE